MKNDTLLTVGLLGIGAYAVYQFSQPVKETIGQVGSGIGTVFKETGGAIGEVSRGVSSPFEYVDVALEGATKTRALKSDVNRRGIEAAAPYSVATSVSKAKSKSIKQDKKTQLVEQSYSTQLVAQKNNYSEQAQRKTEYGSSVKEYAAKMLLPTSDVAQARREAAVKTVKAVVSAPVKAVSAVASKLKATASATIAKAKSIKTSKKK